MSGDLINKIKWDDPRHLIVFQCAPVLWGIKASNLLVIDKDKLKAVHKISDETGVRYIRLADMGDRVTMLLYDPIALRILLGDEERRAFLGQQGYADLRPDAVLSRLACLYQQFLDGNGSFPHELGVILDYPLEDVYGFVANHGRNCLINGYWKVYKHPERARRLFRQYDKCTEWMMQSLVSA